MSRLYFSENGNVIPSLCEELTAWRRARKMLHLPVTTSPSTLHLLARAHEGTPHPLRCSVNGIELPPVPPGGKTGYRWHSIPLRASILRDGENGFEFWTDATAMNAWSLAMEGGHAQPRSFLSNDAGRTWRNEKMGYLNALRGEYVVRVRIEEGKNPAPPAIIWEDPACPRFESLRSLMPAEALRPGPVLPRVRALSAWLSSSWEHTAQDRAALYAPWDAETILSWGKSRAGHNDQIPIVMCVHYGAAFVSCAQAAGIPARCAILMGTPNGYDGHFVAEAWSDQHAKWIMVDPNVDAILWRNGSPLSITEIQNAGSDLAPLIEWGPGTADQRRNPRIVKFIQDIYVTGICFRHRSLWPRADFLSHPEECPPGHGALTYCETALVWERRDLDRGFGMFPHHADPAYFDAPPRA